MEVEILGIAAALRGTSCDSGKAKGFTPALAQREESWPLHLPCSQLPCAPTSEVEDSCTHVTRKKKQHRGEQRNPLPKCPSALFLRVCEAGLSPPLPASNTSDSFQLPTSSLPAACPWPQYLGGFSLGHLDNIQLQWESFGLLEGSLQPSQTPQGNG